jgi:hypothetical protein
MLNRLALIVAFAFCAVSAQAQVAVDPVDLIVAIYKTYRTDNDHPGLPNVYSRRLQDLLDTEQKNTPAGESGKIDWDVFIDGNDWQLSDVRVERVSQTGKRAQVRARFKNHNSPCENLFDLVHERGQWRIDDIQSMRKPRWILSKILLGDPTAFPDDKTNK